MTTACTVLRLGAPPEIGILIVLCGFVVSLLFVAAVLIWIHRWSSDSNVLPLRLRALRAAVFSGSMSPNEARQADPHCNARLFRGKR